MNNASHKVKSLDAQAITVKFYPPIEEAVNIGSHAIACLLSLIGLVFLFIRGLHIYADTDSLTHLISLSTFGISMVVLYAASTAYHSAKNPVKRQRLKVLDHAAIYVLIAGSYTPFTLITLPHSVGWPLFAITWGMALTGITLKLFFTGRFKMISTLMYVFMGWLILFVIDPLINNLPAEGLRLLVMGGISYTVGAILYSIKRIPFNHAIFHILVVIGTAFQFIVVYRYV